MLNTDTEIFLFLMFDFWRITENVHIVHVSCGSEVSWACDNKGFIYLRSGSLSPPSTTDMSPAWVKVEGDPTCGSDSMFTKVKYKYI